MLRIKLIKSPIANVPKNRRTVLGLGLRKVGQTVELPDNPAVRGMVHHVKHLLLVETVEGEPRITQNRAKAKARSARSAGEKVVKPKRVPKEPSQEPRQEPTQEPATEVKPAAAKKPATAKSMAAKPKNSPTKSSAAKTVKAPKPKDDKE